MHKLWRVVILSLGFAVLAAGCRMAPIMNIVDSPVQTYTNKSVSVADVEKAIVRAGSALGWRMRPVKPGLIEGTLSLREHVAVVEIPYTAKSYSIQYKDSTNLKYDGSQIHPNYNGWVQNLDKGIRTQLQNL